MPASCKWLKKRILRLRVISYHHSLYINIYYARDENVITYPCHDNGHFHVKGLLHKQLVVTWFVEEACQPSLIPNPTTSTKTKLEKEIEEHQVRMYGHKRYLLFFGNDYNRHLSIKKWKEMASQEIIVWKQTDYPMKNNVSRKLN